MAYRKDGKIKEHCIGLVKWRIIQAVNWKI